jgi:hypothetical protein
MTTFSLRLPNDLKRLAAAQAGEAGVSLNEYIVAAVASHVSAVAKTRRYFNARAKRATPGSAKAALARAGVASDTRPDDGIE